jgi:SAM-dependent methyltransferase
MAAKGAVKKEDIPAVTQLFTPDWIVRYMVQNSLGRLWLLNHPDSRIRAQMEYYIQPAEPETDFLQVTSPEDLKVLDPACGSGHILTYAFDLLYAIYEEQGYDPVEIPRLILQKNLYGIEIDKRAAMLSSFALMMKALSKDRRFFRRDVSPNILEMEDISFTSSEIQDYMAKVGRDLWTQDLWEGLQQFENAKTFGSLIRPVIKDAPYLRKRMREAGAFGDLFLSRTSEKVEKVLEMAEYLSPRYHVVVANPPYFSKGLNVEYKQFAQEHFPDSKADTFSMFIERNLEFALKRGYVGMITLMSWMFLTSFEELRGKLLSEDTILSMAHLGARAFDTIGGEVVSTTMFTLTNINLPKYSGDYFRLIVGDSEQAKIDDFLAAIADPACGWLFRRNADDFKKIPGSPIAYWVSDNIMRVFSEGKLLSDIAEPRQGLATGDNGLFVRFWAEVGISAIGFNTLNSSRTKKWYPYNKGGSFRKWYGNQDYIVNWENDGYLELTQK